ncbi:MAG: SAM-dependent methyltransferase [Mycobacterium sp.]
MGRTDDDSWDITESVGATALSVARARAAESRSAAPLFTDPYAEFFITAATAAGWQPPFAAEKLAGISGDPQVAARMNTLTAYIATRTRYFDDFFTTAGANGLDQTVILAAGLDTRPWRLPWIARTTIYEIDLPKVLEFKAEVLERHHARPAARYLPVPVDLRHDWPTALRANGFDPTVPTAWLAEGLLPYLSATDQDLLFERVDALSAPGSRLAVEAFGAEFFDPAVLARRREELRAVSEAAAARGVAVPDTEALWYLEPRTDVAGWLQDHGWEVCVLDSREMMQRYHRPGSGGPGDTVPGSLFIEAVREAR